MHHNTTKIAEKLRCIEKIFHNPAVSGMVKGSFQDDMEIRECRILLTTWLTSTLGQTLSAGRNIMGIKDSIPFTISESVMLADTGTD